MVAFVSKKRTSLGIVFLCTLLLSCMFEKGLPSEEVLSRTSLSTRELTTANFLIDGKIKIAGPQEDLTTFDVVLNGTMQNGGQQTSFMFNGEMNSVKKIGKSRLALTGEARVTGPDELYFYLNDFSSEEGSVYSPELLDLIRGKWWQIPPRTDGEAPVMQDISPDPALLRAQSEIVSITKDRGIIKKDGVKMYHYNTEIHQGKLTAFLEEQAREKGEILTQEDKDLIASVHATGELFIDAESFFVHEIHWTIQNMTLSTGRTLTGTVDFTLKNHNQAPPVIPPADATLFSVPSPENVHTSTGAVVPVQESIFPFPFE